MNLVNSFNEAVKALDAFLYPTSWTLESNPSNSMLWFEDDEGRTWRILVRHNSAAWLTYTVQTDGNEIIKEFDTVGEMMGYFKRRWGLVGDSADKVTEVPADSSS